MGNGILGGLVAPLNALDSWFQLLNGTFVVFLFAPIPLAIGGAIFRYHLYDIDILINRTLAERLVLSPKTIRNYISEIYSKLQVTDRVQAMLRARESGFIDNDRHHPARKRRPDP